MKNGIVVETDVLDSVSAYLLFQQGDDWFLHLIAFYSKKNFQGETNYKVYHKKLVAIVRAFKE